MGTAGTPRGDNKDDYTDDTDTFYAEPHAAECYNDVVATVNKCYNNLFADQDYTIGPPASSTTSRTLTFAHGNASYALDVQFEDNVYFAAGTTYKVESDGDAVFKNIRAAGGMVQVGDGVTGGGDIRLQSQGTANEYIFQPAGSLTASRAITIQDPGADCNFIFSKGGRFQDTIEFANGSTYKIDGTGVPTFNIAADDATYTGIVTSDGGVLKYRTKAQLAADIDSEISHTNIADIGSNAHSVIDTHLGASAPHSGHVDTTGDETIAGIKTFSSIPVLPASDPTADNQAARKAYVDSSASSPYYWAYLADYIQNNDKHSSGVLTWTPGTDATADAGFLILQTNNAQTAAFHLPRLIVPAGYTKLDIRMEWVKRQTGAKSVTVSGYIYKNNTQGSDLFSEVVTSVDTAHYYVNWTQVTGLTTDDEVIVAMQATQAAEIQVCQSRIYQLLLKWS